MHKMLKHSLMNWLLFSVLASSCAAFGPTRPVEPPLVAICVLFFDGGHCNDPRLDSPIYAETMQEAIDKKSILITVDDWKLLEKFHSEQCYGKPKVK